MKAFRVYWDDNKSDCSFIVVAAKLQDVVPALEKAFPDHNPDNIRNIECSSDIPIIANQNPE